MIYHHKEKTSDYDKSVVVILLSLITSFEFSTLRKDRVKLYQHSAQCPVAMQIFLYANPHYWSFTPMTIEESQQSEQQSIRHSIEFSYQLDWNVPSKEDCRRYVEAVPKPPTGYTFSNREILLQAQYFHRKRDKKLPNQDIDLYDATVVAARK